MTEYLIGVNPILLALLGGIFTWGMTLLGAGTVFFFKNINKSVLNMMLAFAAGIMVAASFWSLLAPAVEIAEKNSDLPVWIPIIVGFSLGGVLLLIADKIIPHIHRFSDEKEGVSTSWKRSVLLVLAITLHNIPEGLAFGVAFGLVATDPTMFASAVVLSLGIGIQNFPEGAAVSIPLRKEGFTRKRAFFYGQASGIVEPVAAVIGAMFAMSATTLLPYALSFAAGAMMYVVIEELIPEAHSGGEHSHYSTHGAMLGFILMTFLDLALG